LGDRSEQGGRARPFFRSFSSNSYGYFPQTIEKMASPSHRRSRSVPNPTASEVCSVYNALVREFEGVVFLDGFQAYGKTPQACDVSYDFVGGFSQRAPVVLRVPQRE